MNSEIRPKSTSVHDCPETWWIALICLAASAEDTRSALRTAAFRRLIKAYGAHLDKLRHKGKLLAGEWNITSPVDEHDPATRLRSQVFADYVTAEDELQPDNLLRGLLAWLERPDDHFRVGDSGFIAPSLQGVGRETCGVKIPLLETADRRKWLTALISFPIAEGLQAIHAETRVHRYILI